MMKDILFSALIVVVVVVLAAVVGPKGPPGPPDPTISSANPRPDWPFLWLFGLLSLSPRGAETFLILVFPVVLIWRCGPFNLQSGRAGLQPPTGCRAHGDCPFTRSGILTWLGATAPWSPVMTAWSGDPVPSKSWSTRSGTRRHGRVSTRTCRNCHAIDDMRHAAVPISTASALA